MVLEPPTLTPISRLLDRLYTTVISHGLLLVLLTYVSVVMLLAIRTPLAIFSLDDVYRGCWGFFWRQRPFFFTPDLVWLPFPMYVTGVASRLTGEIFYASLIVNVIATAVGMVYAYLFMRDLFGDFVSWLVTTLLALSPWVLFLALSRLSEPVGLACTMAAILYWYRWAIGGGTGNLALASC